MEPRGLTRTVARLTLDRPMLKAKAKVKLFQLTHLRRNGLLRPKRVARFAAHAHRIAPRVIGAHVHADKSLSCMNRRRVCACSQSGTLSLLATCLAMAAGQAQGDKQRPTSGQNHASGSARPMPKSHALVSSLTECPVLARNLGGGAKSAKNWPAVQNSQRALIRSVCGAHCRRRKSCVA
jgi:hypothetical protein